MNTKKLNGHKICEALSLPTRVRILQELIRAYPNRLTISRIQEITSEPRMTIWFHINKLRESNLVELDGSRKGFRAATKALTIKLNGDGIRLEEK
jgi:DNA-binding transcriptional ArsR family regulator